jgi:hypothetical protein
MKFDEEPSYEKLKHVLREALLKKDKVPNNRFDWSRFRRLPSPNFNYFRDPLVGNCHPEEADEGVSSNKLRLLSECDQKKIVQFGEFTIF